MSEISDDDLIAEDLSPFVTTTYGMRGFFAVLMRWYEEDNMWDVCQSGMGSYKTQAGAMREAQDWARAEGIRTKL